MVFGFGSKEPSSGGGPVRPDEFPDADADIGVTDDGAAGVAVLGGGCFWCVDGIYRMIEGVTEVGSGYAGGPFFAIAHDPTQLNRQGNDVGTQYRSVIFHTDAAQREVAEGYIRQLEEANVFAAPIVTEVAPLDAFYDGEDYHQDYAAQNPAQPYIACFSAPKIQKLREYFPEMLKSQSGA
jgi:peptide-methionine (S)-S-oxide reductase